MVSWEMHTGLRCHSSATCFCSCPSLPVVLVLFHAVLKFLGDIEVVRGLEGVIFTWVSALVRMMA